MRPLRFAALASVLLHLSILSFLLIPKRKSDVIRIDLASRQGSAVAGASFSERAAKASGSGPGQARNSGESDAASGVVTQSVSNLLRTIPYPERARMQEMQGLVLVHADIGADGSVSKARVLTSSGFAILDQAALRGVETWHFPKRDTAYRLEIPVRFTMKD